MKHLMILFMSLFLGLVGCKQEAVDFGSAPSELPGEFDTDGDEVVPVQGPMVKIVQAPKDHKQDQETQVVFEVTAGDNEIAEVQCYINKFEIDCDWVKGIVKLFDMPLGRHWFKVVATDVEGLRAQAKEKWSVLTKYRKQSEDLKVERGSKMTDILFVIDNSSSMRYEQTQISQRFPNFINQLDGVNWQIGITTTDARSSRDWGDGKLHRFPSRDWYLTSKMDKAEAQELFSKHVRRDESGNDTETGILVTYRAIERSLTDSNMGHDKALKRFFRKNAALAVVVVSDEDESRNGEKSDGDNLIQLVRESWGQNKIFQFNSIIVHTQQCLNGTGHTMGVKYERLSKKTNGLVGDICLKNYTQLLTDLGQGVADLQRVYKLKCAPQDADDDGKVDLKIVPRNGKRVPGYTIDGDTITFDKHLAVGKYKFHYFCLDE